MSAAQPDRHIFTVIGEEGGFGAGAARLGVKEDGELRQGGAVIVRIDGDGLLEAAGPLALHTEAAQLAIAHQ